MSRERYPSSFPKLPSVTTILGAFPSVQLLNWYRSTDFKEIKEKSERGKDIGSTLHELRSRIEKGDPFEITTKYPEAVQNCLKNYFQWKKERELMKIIHSELQMFSMELGYLGTFDDLVQRGDDLILLEYKTSTGIYDDHLEQTIAYKRLFEACHKKKIKECYVIRFSKDKAEYGTRQIFNEEIDELFEMFNYKLKIYNIRKNRDAKWRSKNATPHDD